MAEAELVTTEPITKGAGFWVRALARIIDIGFGWVLGVVGGVIGGIVLIVLQMAGTVSPGWEHRISGFSLAAFSLALAGGVLYHSVCEGIHGASLGKVICRLRVLQEDGRASCMKGAVIRSLGWYVDGLFLGLIGYLCMRESPLNRRYGDHWGRTIVVRSRDIPVSSRRTAMDFLGGLFLGSACWTLLMALGLVLKAT